MTPRQFTRIRDIFSPTRQGPWLQTTIECVDAMVNVQEEIATIMKWYDDRLDEAIGLMQESLWNNKNPQRPMETFVELYGKNTQ